MCRAKLWPLWLLALLALGLGASEIPAPQGFVNDYARLLSEETRVRLNDWAIELKEKTDVELAIGIFESIGTMDENSHAVKVFETWKIGNQRDEGVLIMLALKERRLKIEVGYGSEPYVTDSYSGDVYRAMRDMLPKGREDWDGAFTQGMLLLLQRIAREKGVTISGVSEFSKGTNNIRADKAKGVVGLFGVLIFIFLIIVTRGRILEVLLWMWILGGRGGGGSWGGGSSGGGGGFGGFGGFGGGRSGGGGAGGGF